MNKLGIINWKSLYKECETLLKNIGFDLDVEKVANLLFQNNKLLRLQTIFQNASVVVMDEPTSSLTPKEIEKLFEY